MNTQLETPAEPQWNEAASADPAESEAQSLVRLLTSVMSLGQMGAMWSEVQKILLLLKEMVVDIQPLLVNLAVARAVMGDGSSAQVLLDNGVDHLPDPDMATISLATALQLAGDARWEAYAHRVLSTSSDPKVRDLAETLLLAHEASSH